MVTRGEKVFACLSWEQNCLRTFTACQYYTSSASGLEQALLVTTRNPGIARVDKGESLCHGKTLCKENPV